jgi:ABC-2 type transport system permease protein
MVIRREYLERVTKKSFWIGTLVFPLLMGVLIGGQFLLMMVKTGEQRKLAFVDETGRLFAQVDAKLSEKKLNDGRREFVLENVPIEGDAETTRRELEARVNDGEMFGIVVVGEDLAAKDNFRFYGANVGNVIATETLESAIEDAVIGVRLEDSKLALDRKTLDTVMAPVELETFQVTRAGEAKKKNFLEAYFGTFAFVMVLYMSLLLYGIAVMRGILEEKSSRIMEVLLGPLTPGQLMTGKILGIGLVGLTQIAVYVLAAGTMRLYFVGQTVQADWTSMLDAFTLDKMIYFVLFFLLGYFLYVALFASIGAVCNTEQEAQNLTTSVTMCLVVPMIATFFFVNNPDSIYAVVVSLIPIFTPMVMYMRISVLTPPFWQIALSIVLMVVTVYFLFRGAAKIFRVGILMYGKRPTIPEILRWARS